MAEKVTRAVRAARGVLFVHSSPRALCPHVEWAAGRALGRAVNFDWAEQPVLRGSLRAEFYWEGEAGTGAKLASALRGWEHLRFEVSEDPTPGSDGARWMHTPDLGVFFAQTDTAGNIVDRRGPHPLRDGGRRARRARAAPRAATRARPGVGRRARAVPPRQ